MDGSVFKGWARPGPRPPGGIAPESDETLDYLCGHWKVFQYGKGHRFSVDDVLTAWFGTVCCPRADRIADLGSGIGSVGMAAAWRCPSAVVHTVEAQELSVRLARKSARYNGILDRYFIHEGDLREPELFPGEAPFDLVLGSPPYWPLGTRTEAGHPQAIPARLEVRGDVADYALAAARLLAPGGVFVCVFPSDQLDRAAEAYRKADLILLRRQDVLFKEGQRYGLGLFAGCKRQDLPPEFERNADLPGVADPLIIRRKDGRIHPGMALVRLVMGFPPGAV
jgi:tRNA1Val (adenine37-N6)-methyltransferase